ncbi:hypothetical protein GUJ93_ZPchr0002g25504 [Zizania palustris]|uniref:C2 domain-containing protein n=1 Tax=Zizania palustris TaxID=103762 RepID=A0A8J5SGD3_ZIZPA|nr:hypothetical protein GUJ93_ZPchr0002g25504 [Zizania palustris]
MACAETTTRFAGKQQPPAMAFASRVAASWGMGMTLEVTVLSAEEVVLPSGRTLGGGAYAVVHAAAAAASTRVSEDGDCNGYPLWGETVRVDMPAGTRGLDVEICRRRPNGKAESVAAARVPVGDFTVGPPGHLHCLSYRLSDAGSTTSSARRNGIVNITVKRTDITYIAPPPPREGRAPVPAAGKAMDAGASGSGSDGSCYGVAPAGTAMGYPIGFSADGNNCV